MQGGVIAEGLNNIELFPMIGNFSVYKAYLGMFGWNGKTKEFCFNILLLNIAIYFVMCLFALIRTTRLQRGRRALRGVENDDRLF